MNINYFLNRGREKDACNYGLGAMRFLVICQTKIVGFAYQAYTRLHSLRPFGTSFGDSLNRNKRTPFDFPESYNSKTTPWKILYR